MKRFILFLLVFVPLLVATPALAQDGTPVVQDTAVAEFFEYLIVRFELEFIAGGIGLLLVAVEGVQWLGRKYLNRDPAPQLVALVFVVLLVGVKSLVNANGIDETQVATIVNALNRLVLDVGPWVLAGIGINWTSAVTARQLKAAKAPGFRSKSALKAATTT